MQKQCVESAKAVLSTVALSCHPGPLSMICRLLLSPAPHKSDVMYFAFPALYLQRINAIFPPFGERKLMTANPLMKHYSFYAINSFYGAHSLRTPAHISLSAQCTGESVILNTTTSIDYRSLNAV